jgi:hypothetical protein
MISMKWVCRSVLFGFLIQVMSLATSHSSFAILLAGACGEPQTFYSTEYSVNYTLPAVWSLTVVADSTLSGDIALAKNQLLSAWENFQCSAGCTKSAFDPQISTTYNVPPGSQATSLSLVNGLTATSTIGPALDPISFCEDQLLAQEHQALLKACSKPNQLIFGSVNVNPVTATKTGTGSGPNGETFTNISCSGTVNGSPECLSSGSLTATITGSLLVSCSGGAAVSVPVRGTAVTTPGIPVDLPN